MDLDMEPVDEKEYCNEKSHSPAFDSGQRDSTKFRKIKIKFIKKVGHESSEQSLKRKSEDRATSEARDRKKERNKVDGREKKSVGHEISDEADQSLNQACQRTIEDDVFIDDIGVDPHDRILTDDGFIHNAPQAEEGEGDNEINNLLKSKKKKKKGFERSPEETTMIIERFLAKFEVAAEEDAEFNRQSRPAVNKLKMLPLLTEALSKKQLQQEFLDRGILSVLKNWLEPLPDGCLPNINIRTAILKILTDLPVKIEQFDRREVVKKSGIGKSIVFLSKSDEEIPSNRKLAKDLVDKWIRPIFQKSTRYEDMRDFGEERVPYIRPPPSSITKEKALALRFEDDGDGFDFLGLPQKPKPEEKGYKAHAIASRPKASRVDYVVRPQSKIDPEEIRARTKQQKQSERWTKLDKKLKNLKAPKKKMLQAAKINVDGRGLVKYF